MIIIISIIVTVTSSHARTRQNANLLFHTELYYIIILL